VLEETKTERMTSKSAEAAITKKMRVKGNLRMERKASKRMMLMINRIIATERVRSKTSLELTRTEKTMKMMMKKRSIRARRKTKSTIWALIRTRTRIRAAAIMTRRCRGTTRCVRKTGKRKDLKRKMTKGITDTMAKIRIKMKRSMWSKMNLENNRMMEKTKRMVKKMRK
jgi:hypothetical protein